MKTTSKRLILILMSPTIILLALFINSCIHVSTSYRRPTPIIKVLDHGQVKSIPIEQYVASVLAGEISAFWPEESLCAQAIAARTFVLKRMKERANGRYHVQNSVADQVMKANPAQSLIKAAQKTAGMVLIVNGTLAETSFHSTCGGRTTDAKNVWGRSLPHLKSRRCTNCKNSPSFSWNTTIARNYIEAKIKHKISDIEILSRTEDGRIDLLKIHGGKSITMSGHQFRMAIGPMKLRSTLIDSLTLRGESVYISGRGFGHGVGMCQYGALGMAKNRKNFKDILRYYYPHTTIKRIY